MKVIRDLLAAHHISTHSPEDPTPSSGEHAQVTIVAALTDSWDRLDGHQQHAIADALGESAVDTGGRRTHPCKAIKI